VTRTVASTPGPQHPERRTDSDDTERDRPAPEAELPQIPGFLVQAEIGRGGMGVVYRAVHLEMAKTVALKVIYTLGRDPEVVRGRFAREVQALARLEHPNVVPIYHAGQWHGFPYFTMKFAPAGPLSRHLGRFHGDAAACARLVAKVARAVQELHDHKVIHRDLKPLNILLGDSDEPLVADFGLAKWTDDDADTARAGDHPISGTGVPLGTRHYMAPEQTRGERTDFPEAADIWALGVTLYELLVGVRPFPDDGRSDLAERIREQPAPPLPDSVPVPLAVIVARCLAKAPADRYPTAAAVADDLERWLAGLPVVATLPPTGRGASPEREVPRRRGWLVGVGLLALVMLVALPAALIPWGQPGARPARTVPERLGAGETVWLLRENELPHVLDMPGGRAGTLSIDPRGFCAVGTADVAVIELAAGHDMPPFVLEAEVAPVTGNELSRFGVYTGRQSWGPPEALHQAFYGVKVCAPPDKLLPPGAPRGTVEAEAIYVTPTAPYMHKMSIVPGHEYDPPAIVPNAPPNWHPIRVRVTRDEYAVTVLGRQLPRIGTPLAAGELQKFLDIAPGAPRVGGPLDGGIGLFVSNGKALYRNVRLTPATN
jgi:hypothetical protein